MLVCVAVDVGCDGLEVVVQLPLDVGQRIAVENVDAQPVQAVGRDLPKHAAIGKAAGRVRGRARQSARRVSDIGKWRALVVRALREITLSLEQRWDAELID